MRNQLQLYSIFFIYVLINKKLERFKNSSCKGVIFRKSYEICRIFLFIYQRYVIITK